MGVVVTYHPDDTLPSRVRLLANQIDAVMLVDNCSGPSALSALRQAAGIPGVTLVVNSENLGIAAGMNIGLRRAMEQGYDWVATFDQDSSVRPHYFENLLGAFDRCLGRDMIAMLVPNYFEEAIGRMCHPSEDFHGPVVEVDRTQTSGSLIKVSCLSKVGLFDESLFIDYVDHEFCLRLMRAGFKVLRSNTCVLQHNLGHTTEHNFLGRRFYTSQHDSSRRYYMARNRLLVYKRYFTFSPGWILRDLHRFLKDILKVTFVEENTITKLSATLRGLCHGAIGRSGRL